MTTPIQNNPQAPAPIVLPALTLPVQMYGDDFHPANDPSDPLVLFTAKVLYNEMLSDPGMYMFIFDLATMRGGTIPDDILGCSKDPNITRAAVLFNAVALGYSYSEYTVYALQKNPQVPRVWKSVPNAIPQNDCMGRPNPNFPTYHNVLQPGSGLNYMEKEDAFHKMMSQFFCSPEDDYPCCFGPCDCPDFTSSDEDFEEDLTEEGIEPNPGPSNPEVENQALQEAPQPQVNPPALVPAPLVPVQNIIALLQIMTLFQKIYFLMALPYTITYAFIAIAITTRTRFVLNPVMSPQFVNYCFMFSCGLISYLATKMLIRILLLMAGVEPNPGPVPNSKSEQVLPCESPETLSADFSNELQRERKHSRSQEKRNSKFSSAHIKKLLRAHQKEQKLTCLRQQQRRLKNDRWSCETPFAPYVSHNTRRLQKFLAQKETTQIRPNGRIKQLFVRCCAQKDDEIYQFLTKRCHFDEMTSMALTPIVKAIKSILINKITIGLALCILSYYLAKYIQLPALVFAPIIALILSYLVADIAPDVIDAVTKLYSKLSKAFLQAKADIVHITDVTITHNTFQFVFKELVGNAIFHSTSDRTGWRDKVLDPIIDKLTGIPNHMFPLNTEPFSYSVPEYVHKFLCEVDKTKLSLSHLKELKEALKPNGLSEMIVDLSQEALDVFTSVGLLAKTFTLPAPLHFYANGKKFVKQLHEMFTDLYPPIYEFITGKKYIDPTVAKYMAIFGDITKKVHETLKEARQSNITKESAPFRLRIILEYEELLESQLKLLEVKAPPQYMNPINGLIREMSTLANECYSRAKGEADRDEPVLILLRGPPGVGKTTVDHALALIIGERLKMKVDLKTDFFPREPGVEHWDGYENQTFVNFDDAFQIVDPVSQAVTILEIIKAKNRAPYKLTMAALEAKKSSFFNSKFIFISTNVPNVVCNQISDIGAFYRRIDFDVSIASRPEPNADGSLNFNYDLQVNGVVSDIVTLADSIVALHVKRSLVDLNVAQALVKFAKHAAVTPTDKLLPARNSTKDFHGKETTRPNGLTEFVRTAYCAGTNRLSQKAGTICSKLLHPFMTSLTGDKTRASCLEVLSTTNEVSFLVSQFLKWVGIFAVGSVALTMLVKLFKGLAQVMPNSRREKDKLTGDKTTQVASQKQAISQKIQALQAKLDSKMVQAIKPNSSVERWTGSMKEYIKVQGWEDKEWVQASLASITFTDNMECTDQEKADLKVLRSNIISINTWYEYKGCVYKMYAKALILNENHLIAPTHQLPQTCKILKLEVVLGTKEINIANYQLDRIENSDTTIITLSTVLPCRDISYMFSPMSELTAKDSKVFLLRNFDDVLTICPVTDFAATDRIINYTTDFNEIIRCGSVFDCKVAVCTGDSGCFYVIRDQGRFKIVGMHVASGPTMCHGRFITREMLKNYIRPPRKAIVPYDHVTRVLDENSRSFDERLACNSNCIPIGIVEPRTMIASHSKIQRSVLYRHIDLPTPTEFQVRLKRTYDLQDGLLKANAKFRIRDDIILEPELEEEIVHALEDAYPNTPVNRFYSNVEAIQGTDHMPKIAMNTSSGYVLSAQGKTPKSNLEEADWASAAVHCDDHLEDLYNGHMPQGIFQTSFKDELRPHEKVENPRVINCAPLALTMLFRRVLGPLMNMLHTNYNKTRCKVGINAHGEDWKQFFSGLARISEDNIVELDYSGYEYNHSQRVFILLALFVYRLYIRSGFSERDAKAAQLLILSCAGGYVIQNEVLIFVWMLLSGLPITAELNSLLNEIYQMIAYKKLTSKPLITMRSFVESGFYGDDLVHAVCETIKEQFNALTIQKFCQEFLGMKVTPASNKSGDMPKFIHILECSFLCRKFAPREGRVDAPIKLDSMTNSLQYYTPVTHMTQRELLAAKCNSFITELTHYPPEIYAYWTDILMKIKSQHNLKFICHDYPSALARRIVMEDTY